MIYQASCHCAAYQARLFSDAELRPRSCACGFCRRHGARTFSDPNGNVQFKTLGAHVYRFGFGVTDYLVCPTCGVYLGALMRVDGANLATLNLNCLIDQPPMPEPVAVDYEGESVEERMARRRRNWTPVADGWT
jgi:hypothetical protein